MGGHAEEVTEGTSDLLNLLGKLASGSEDEHLSLVEVEVDRLQDGNRESTSLTSTGLSLHNGVVTRDNGENTTLLNHGGLLETVGVNATKELLLETHLIEAGDNLVPVGLDDVAVGVNGLGVALVIRGGGVRGGLVLRRLGSGSGSGGRSSGSG